MYFETGKFIRGKKGSFGHKHDREDHIQPKIRAIRSSEKWPKVHVLPPTWRNFRKNFIPDFGLDLSGAGHNHDWDTRIHPRIDQPRWPGKYHMIIHVHEVLVFLGGLCFFVWLFRSGCFVLFDCLDRGCFVWGCLLGGACEDFSFWKAARAICGITNRQN